MTTPRVGSLGVLSATGNMLFRDASGNVDEVDTAGAVNGDVLTRVAGLPTWSAPIGVLDAFEVFSPADAIFAAVNSQTGIAEPVGRNNHPVLAFIDTAAAPADNENVVFSSVIPILWDVSNDLEVRIDWVAATAVVGNVKWNAAFEALAPGAQDIDADGFAAVQTSTSATDGTSGVITRTLIVFTQAQADALTAGTAFRLQIVRDANNVGSDTLVGDAQIMQVSIAEIL